MLDNRVNTFLTLCELMNYRATAEKLNMTQPAVTQHIQFLEAEYGCKLFEYTGRRLFKTTYADILKRAFMSAHYNDVAVREQLLKPTKTTIRFGATKTIGDYCIMNEIGQILQDDNVDLTVSVDNTSRLLQMLDQGLIDFALIEGFFDKKIYGYKPFKTENFVGICNNHHPFAGKDVSFEDIFNQKLIVRELGSGTRDVLEQFLHENNYTIKNFKKTATISSFKVIETMVLNNCGISFTYSAIPQENRRLATFSVNKSQIKREFNFVYLKNTTACEMVDFFIK